MITLKNFAVGFLRNVNTGCYLLLKRREDKEYAPGRYSGLGGNMEPAEMNNPLAACYREIEEESGIARDDIISLNLLYIIVQRFGDVVTHDYVYFGETARADFVQSGEGRLSWVARDKLSGMEYTQSFIRMMSHYLARPAGCQDVFIGAAEDENGGTKVVWTRCGRFERNI